MNRKGRVAAIITRAAGGPKTIPQSKRRKLNCEMEDKNELRARFYLLFL
jgi:hypothetical protein